VEAILKRDNENLKSIGGEVSVKLHLIKRREK
jgi:hypothetical protein